MVAISSGKLTNHDEKVPIFLVNTMDMRHGGFSIAMLVYRSVSLVVSRSSYFFSVEQNQKILVVFLHVDATSNNIFHETWQRRLIFCAS